VLRVLDRVNRELGTTTAIVTHNVAIAAIGDRVVRMSSGEIQEIVSNAERADVDEVSW
jgi:putative ABC transport system ATP-binding protein